MLSATSAGRHVVYLLCCRTSSRGWSVLPLHWELLGVVVSECRVHQSVLRYSSQSCWWLRHSPELWLFQLSEDVWLSEASEWNERKILLMVDDWNWNTPINVSLNAMSGVVLITCTFCIHSFIHPFIRKPFKMFFLYRRFHSDCRRHWF